MLRIHRYSRNRFRPILHFTSNNYWSTGGFYRVNSSKNGELLGKERGSYGRIKGKMSKIIKNRLLVGNYSYLSCGQRVLFIKEHDFTIILTVERTWVRFVRGGVIKFLCSFSKMTKVRRFIYFYYFY